MGKSSFGTQGSPREYVFGRVSLARGTARDPARSPCRWGNDRYLRILFSNGVFEQQEITQQYQRIIAAGVRPVSGIAERPAFVGFLARDPFQQFVPVDFAHRERDGRRGERTLVESDPRDARGVRFDKARPGAQDRRWRRRRLAGGLGLMTHRRPAHGAEHVPDRRQAATQLGRDSPRVMALGAHSPRVRMPGDQLLHAAARRFT
jgi:hypothetical protein